LILPEKLRDYLLSPNHPIGRYKAAFFRSLGYEQDDWEALEHDIRSLLTGNAEEMDVTEYGTKYSILGPITGPNGRSTNIVSVWIILMGEDVPRFVTAYPEDWTMTISELDAVVLEADLPPHGLKKGDVGAVVEIYTPDAVEVEFVTASGRTQAVVTLGMDQVRPVGPKDILAVRQLDAAWEQCGLTIRWSSRDMNKALLNHNGSVAAQLNR
jgi:Domain of unknown function (DUF6883)/Domain of unknown function (DUF4926)